MCSLGTLFLRELFCKRPCVLSGESGEQFSNACYLQLQNNFEILLQKDHDGMHGIIQGQRGWR